MITISSKMGGMRWGLVSTATPSAGQRRLDVAVRWMASASSNVSSSDPSKPGIQLYQFAICPFCNRVKALLAYSQTPYEAIEVNPLTKSEIKWSKDHRKVPIATIHGEPVFSSDNIIQALLKEPAVVQRLENRWKGGSMTMDIFDTTANSTSTKEAETSKEESLIESKDEKAANAMDWKKFATEDLASLLYPNICRTYGDAWVAFGYVNRIPTFGTLERFLIRGLGAAAMNLAASKVKQKRNITDEQQALDDVLNTFEVEGLGGPTPQSNFLSGLEEPNLDDLAVYGVLRSIDGLPAHKKAIYERGGTLAAWYTRMKEKVDGPYEQDE